jgi:HPt (histidine-containing phosphotransfer) domain-containing protein
MQMLPLHHDPFDLEMALGLVDGNEVLLRQVLDQFRHNTESSIAKIQKATHTESEVADARFEARSIASAASTLGAESLSQSALAVENALVDLSDAATLHAAVLKLKNDFRHLAAFIKAHTKTEAEGDDVDGSAEVDAIASSEVKQHTHSAAAHDEGGLLIGGRQELDTAGSEAENQQSGEIAGLASASTGATAVKVKLTHASASGLVHQMMHDQLFQK